jgi:hypothetical protein
MTFNNNSLLATLFIGVVLSILPDYLNAQCPTGFRKLEIDITTDTWGFETYWQLTPAADQCGVNTIAAGGNIGVGCNGGGAQSVNGSELGAYSNNSELSPAFQTCIAEGTALALHIVDDWNNGGNTYEVFDECLSLFNTGPMEDVGDTTIIFSIGLDHNALVRSVAFLDSQYTSIPIDQVSDPFILEAEVLNAGVMDINNIDLTFNVYHENMSSNVFTETVNVASSMVSCEGITVQATNSFTPTSTGLYIAEFIVSISDNDQLTTNDTAYTSIMISDSVYARDDGNVDGDLGIFGPTGAPAGENAHLGLSYHVTFPTYLTSVSFQLESPTVGNPMTVDIFDMVAGKPNSVIDSTVTHIIQPGHVNGSMITTPMANGPLLLLPGNYFFGLREAQNNVTIATSKTIFTAGTGFVNWNSIPPTFGAWANNEDFGATFSDFIVTYILHPNFAVPFTCPVIATNAVVTDVSSFGGSNGSIDLSTANGAGPYTFLWNTGDTTEDLNNLILGTYIVNITDVTGCTASDTFEIIEDICFPMALSFTTSDAISGTGGSSAAGGADLAVIGGFAPYSFLWSNGANTEDLTDVPAGTYTVIVTDLLDCSETGTVTIGATTCARPDPVANPTQSGNTFTFTFPPHPSPTQPGTGTQIQIRAKSNQPGCAANNRTAIAGANSTTKNIDFNNANCGCTYQARLRYRCYNSGGITVNSQWKFRNNIPTTCLRLGDSEFENGIELFPNPASENLNLEVVIDKNEYLTVAVYNSLGAKVIHNEFDGMMGHNLYSLNISDLASGVYTVVINGQNELFGERKFMKTQ